MTRRGPGSFLRGQVGGEARDGLSEVPVQSAHGMIQGSREEPMRPQKGGRTRRPRGPLQWTQLSFLLIGKGTDDERGCRQKACHGLASKFFPA